MVDSFCCFRLHTAAVLIGWIGAVLSLLNVASYIVIITKIDDFVKDWIIDNVTDNDIIDYNIDPAAAKVLVLIILIVYLILNAINCASSCLLIAGAIKERHLMIVPWLLNAGLSIGYTCINVISFVIFMIVNGAAFGAIIIVILFASIILGIELYAWSAMYSLFKLIRQSAEQQRLILPHKAGNAYPNYTRI